MHLYIKASVKLLPTFVIKQTLAFANIRKTTDIDQMVVRATNQAELNDKFLIFFYAAVTVHDAHKH